MRLRIDPTSPSGLSVVTETGTNVFVTGSSTSGTSDHAELTNLDYASSGHTGFQPAGDYGDVSKVGTPVDNQIAVWTGDGTIEGDASLTYDKSTHTITGGTETSSFNIQGTNATTDNTGGADVFVTGGAATGSATGGEVYIEAGSGDMTDGSGNGGNVSLVAGEGGATGDGGVLSFEAGNGGSTSGRGGSAFIYGGWGQGGDSNGGDIGLQPGGKHGSGIDGAVKIYEKTGTNSVALSTSSISAPRVQTFPNKDGTFAMTSDITGTNSGTNTGDVTISGEDYLTMTGQAITMNAIDLDNLSATGTPAATNYLRGDNTWAEVAVGSGGYAANVYPSNTDSDVSGYKKLSYSPDVGETIKTVVVNNNEVLSTNYIYDSHIGITTIPSGIWTFNFRSKVSTAVGTTRARFVIFMRDTSDNETELFSHYSSDINNTDYSDLKTETAQPIFTCNHTDRLGMRVYYSTTHNANVTVSTAIGTTNASYLNTPIQLRHSQLREPNEETDVQHLTAAQVAMLHASGSDNQDLSGLAPKNNAVMTGTTQVAKLDVANTNGTLSITSVSDGGDFNISHAESGEKTLAIYGSAGNTMNVDLLDGDLTVSAGNLSVTSGTISAGGAVTGSNLSGTNTGDITISGEDYLSITNQAITTNPIDLDNLSATGSPSASTFLRGDNTWAAPAGGGDTIAPATNSADYIPQWDGANSKTLKNGIPTSTFATTSTKLDDFATPDNNTDLDANTTNHGLLLKATAPAAGLINVVGIANGETSYANKALFDATAPSTQAFGDAAATGSATVAARRDHKHAMPATTKDTTAQTGILKGNGSAISAASAGTDYVAPSGALGTPSSGTLTNCTGLPTAGLVDDSVTDDKMDYPRWYQEIARTTLASPADVITVSSIPARKYLRFLFIGIAADGTLDTNVTLNNDTGNNYCRYKNVNGTLGNDVSLAAQSWESGATDSGQISNSIIEVVNLQSYEKNMMATVISQDAAGAATLPTYVDLWGKWANTSAQINRIDWTNTGTGNFAAGSEIVVLGHN